MHDADKDGEGGECRDSPMRLDAVAAMQGRS
jgi:hypothetical protein